MACVIFCVLGYRLLVLQYMNELINFSNFIDNQYTYANIVHLYYILNNTLLQQITVYSRIINLHFSIIKISNKLQATNQPKVPGQNIYI